MRLNKTNSNEEITKIALNVMIFHEALDILLEKILQLLENMRKKGKYLILFLL